MSDLIRPVTDEEIAEYLALHRKHGQDDEYWNCDLDANVTVRQIIARIEADRSRIAELEAAGSAVSKAFWVSANLRAEITTLDGLLKPEPAGRWS